MSEASGRAGEEGCDIAAVRELQRRLTRLRLMVMVPTIPLAFTGGALVLGLLAMIGPVGREVSVPAMMLFGFGAVMGTGWAIYRTLARVFAPAWLRELAREHGLSPKELELTAAPYLRARTPRVAFGRWALAGVVGFASMLVVLGVVYFTVNR